MAGTLFEQTLQEAAAFRERVRTGDDVVRRADATLETNPMGVMRWYLHPELTRPNSRALYFHELEIAPGSRSGLLRCQGGIVHYVLEGRGHTELDGTAHEWEADDVIAIPITESGSVYRHVNTGPDPARLLVVWPNYDSALGPEAGVELTVLEPCPEYAAAG